MISFRKYWIQLFCKHIKINSINNNINKRLISNSRISSSEEISIMPTLERKNEIMSASDYRSVNGIQCFGNSIVDPFQSFECYEWHKRLSHRMSELCFTTPTPIQAQTLPLILNKRDLVAIASSGSGKTLAFVLPALVRTLTAGLDYWPKCLILTPTRELTHQIEKVVKKFRFTRSVCLYGGVSREVQTMLLKEVEPHIVIATPARLETFLQKDVTHLQYVDYVVIDEADRMLAMGYESAFRNVMNLLPKRRQTLMFSATWPQSVQALAQEFLCDYVQVQVNRNKSNDSLTVNKNIQQIVIICKESDKQNKLIECINKYVSTVSGFMKTIIFVRTKRTADKLSKFLKNEYLYARALHKNKSQPERDFVVREFQKGTIPIICATDVASRGLDFKNVKLVINYDFPQDIETYIHRIGRTGRNESKGTALTLFTPQNIHHKQNLINVLRESEQHVSQELIDLTLKSESINHELEDSGYESSSSESEDQNH